MFMVASVVVNCAQNAPAPDRACSCACEAEDAAFFAYQQAALRALCDTGLELVAGVRARVRANGGALSEADDLAYHRLSRAVRLSLAMMAQARAATKDAAIPPRITTAGSPRAARKAELDATLEAVIEKESDTPFLERRTRLMRERLTEAADREDFLNRPRGEIIARICQDLGLKIDWRDWWDGPEWALEAAEAEGVDPNNPPPRPPVVNGKSPGPDRARVLLALLAKHAPPDSPFSAQALAKARYEKPKPPPPDDRPSVSEAYAARSIPPTPDLPRPSPHALTRAARRQALARKLADGRAGAKLNRLRPPERAGFQPAT